MNKNWISVSALVVALGVPAGVVSARAYAAAPAEPSAITQDRTWDQPPDEYRDMERRGFHDGVEGARRDFDNHRPPSPENREEYRHPHVPRDMRHDYREGFRRGYQEAMRHMTGDGDQYRHRDHDDDHEH